MKDNLSLGVQLFNVSDKKTREKVDIWLTGYRFDEEGNPVSLEKAMDEDWKRHMTSFCSFSFKVR